MNETRKKIKSSRRAKIAIICAAIILVSIFIMIWMMKTAPRPQLRIRAEEAALVEVSSISIKDERVEIMASGTVSPSRDLQLKSRVSGEIIEINPDFIPGACLPAGEKIIQIDPRDYRLALERQKSQAVKAEADFSLEQGRQDIARHEWELLNQTDPTEDPDGELALRQPQLHQAQASLASAWAALSQAELDLERTSIAAPFNAVVLSKDVSLGTQVTPSTLLGRLAGTDEFWVFLTLPVSDLDWFSAGRDSGGARVQLSSSASESSVRWEGRVIKKLSSLEEKGRLAQVIVAVPDPLNQAEIPLLLGQFVRARIEGRQLKRVIKIPNSSLREGDSVWVIDTDNRLRIKPVEVLWNDGEIALIRDGIKKDELLIVSDLVTPVEGMLLSRLENIEEDIQ